MNSYIIFDVETGGLTPEKNAITEFALLSIRGDDFSELTRYQTYVQQYDDNLEYTEGALNATGIGWKEINSGKSIQNVINDIVDQFKQSSVGKNKRDKPVLVGHNVQFDIGFLNQIMSYSKTKVDLSKLLAGNWDYYGNFRPVYFDTQHLAMAKWQQEKSYKLEKCIEKAGLDLTDAHNAMNDVEGTKELFVKLIQDLRSSSSSQQSEEKRYRQTFQF